MGVASALSIHTHGNPGRTCLDDCGAGVTSSANSSWPRRVRAFILPSGRRALRHFSLLVFFLTVLSSGLP